MDESQTLSRLSAAQRGNDAALTDLVIDFLPFIRRKAALAAAQSAVEQEDLVQEGMIGLLSAVRTFDPSGGAAFRTWAFTCIVNRMRSVVRSAHRAGAVPAEAVVPIEDVRRLVADDDPERQIIARDEVARLRERMQERLSVREQQVLQLYLSGSSYAAIADKLSMSGSKAVDNAMQRIRKKMRSR